MSQAMSKPPACPAQPLGSAANPQEQTIAEKVEAMKRELSIKAGSTFEATVQAADEDMSREATVKMAKLIDDLISELDEARSGNGGSSADAASYWRSSSARHLQRVWRTWHSTSSDQAKHLCRA